MNKGFIVIIVVFILIIAGFSIYGVDSYRVGKNLPPMFCFKIEEYSDGSALLQGFLYRVIEYKDKDGNITYKIGFMDLKYEKEEI